MTFGKPDTSIALNGALAGLVSITAGCNLMSPAMAALTGAIGGAIVVVFSVTFFERMRSRRSRWGPISVHGVCGAWGTLAVGLFSSAAGVFRDSSASKLLGVVVAFALVVPCQLS